MASATLAFSCTAVGVSSSSQVALSYQGLGGGERIVLTSIQTYAVDLAMIPAAGCKGLRVELETTDNDGATVSTPITMQWTSNAVSKTEELSPGGVFQIASPAPVHGITALSLISTANAVVHVTALG